MIENILVVGGTGMLGMPVVFKLILNGYNIRIFTRSERKASLIFGEIAQIFPGDVRYIEDLRHAMAGVDAVHINLSGEIELIGVRNIVQVAKEQGIKLITYISGDSVREENAWFPMTRRKLQAEKLIASSGIDFIVFRPTWFMESIPLFVRNGRAVHLGIKDIAFHFVAAEDYATIVARAFNMPQARGKYFHIYGPEKITFYQALLRYINAFHPKIKKVSRMPFFLANLVAFISYSPELAQATKMMKYFARVGECGDPGLTYQIFGPPKLTFDQWLEKRKKLTSPEFFEQFK